MKTIRAAASSTAMVEITTPKPTIPQLEYAATGAGRRVVDRLGQLNPVEGGDLAHYGHKSMLGARVGGHDPWRRLFVGVVPRGRDRRGALVDR